MTSLHPAPLASIPLYLNYDPAWDAASPAFNLGPDICREAGVWLPARSVAAPSHTSIGAWPSTLSAVKAIHPWTRGRGASPCVSSWTGQASDCSWETDGSHPFRGALSSHPSPQSIIICSIKATSADSIGDGYSYMAALILCVHIRRTEGCGPRNCGELGCTAAAAGPSPFSEPDGALAQVAGNNGLGSAVQRDLGLGPLAG